MWKDYLVSHLFDMHTTNLIQNTLIFPKVTIDTLVWKGEKNGRYFVHSAYQICTYTIRDAYHLRRLG